ncbi:4-hydroxybenzoate 3-monooxygenase [Allorhizocola rhizosphaerae]|uniref:4-hydroxybenzoate 3-monooxygenase n=1 Tax=Allorhizocola rhizosphaerae TaxID=1872709 RepID=UPI000E3D9BB6|nr:4-hydroxybenzoate 3-monooxygenase [Allorhizocola rhizosphaerae]
MRTQVGIIGAGPAGLVLAHLLHLRGVDSVVLERHTRAHIESRIRAGVLEQGTVELLCDIGLGERLMGERMVHSGLELLFDGVGHRVPLKELTGYQVTIYGQHELVKDLVAARLATGRPLLFGVSDVTVDPAGTIRFVHDGKPVELECDLIAGCDGFHGVSRSVIPKPVVFEHVYPYAWLGVLAEAPPSSEELIYAHHAAGFALHSMRSPQLTRLYLQVDPDDSLESWPAARIWEQLRLRLSRVDTDWRLADGPIIEQSITGLRSFVVDPMQHDRLFLAGDAAHIVPATGAKGLNLAIADVVALDACHASGRLASYSDICLRRVWRVQHFSWWMTSMLHRVPDPFAAHLQLSQLRYLTSSTAAATSFAENYVGLPLNR